MLYFLCTVIQRNFQYPNLVLLLGIKLIISLSSLSILIKVCYLHTLFETFVSLAISPQYLRVISIFFDINFWVCTSFLLAVFYQFLIFRSKKIIISLCNEIIYFQFSKFHQSYCDYIILHLKWWLWIRLISDFNPWQWK